LNNLGYISELEGQLDRAIKFYKLAAQQGSNANIDLSSVRSLQGQPMQAAFSGLEDVPMRVNRLNLEAVICCRRVETSKLRVFFNRL
jgi:hypothetical protein